MVQARKEQLVTLRAYWSKTSYSGTGGTSSTNILLATLNAASVTGTSGGNATSATPVRGIVTAGTANLCKIRTTDDGYALLDSQNDVIYGRITVAGPNYVVSYVKLNGGSEVSTSLPGIGAIDIDLLFPEVMNYSEVPAVAGIIDEAGFILGGTGTGGGGSGGGETLSQTLALGNSTNGNDIQITDGDLIVGTDAAPLSNVDGGAIELFGGTGDGAGNGGGIFLIGGDGSGGGSSSGGGILLRGGMSSAGNGGNIVLDGGSGLSGNGRVIFNVDSNDVAMVYEPTTQVGHIDFSIRILEANIGFEGIPLTSGTDGADLNISAQQANNGVPGTTIGGDVVITGGDGGPGLNLSNGGNVILSGGSGTSGGIDGYVKVASGFVTPVSVVTGTPYAVLISDYNIFVNFAGSVAVTLVASPPIGLTYVIKDISGLASANNITITPFAGTIDGDPNYIITSDYESITVVYNGTEWSII